MVNLGDGTEVVYLPPRAYRLGARVGDDGPLHDVRLERGAYLGKREVTWAQYRRFCAATEHPLPRLEGATYAPEGEDHPVYMVTIDDARAYCAWAGGRLPSELEWACAAQGPRGTLFPWGDSFHRPGDAPRANIADQATARRFGAEWPYDLQQRVDDGFGITVPAGSFPDGASIIGCLDLAGNVGEWVECGEADKAVNRGGGWSETDWGCRSSARFVRAPGEVGSAIGFRVACDPP
jgi:formylglycine-generating enzyme required for sulfatase activity